MPKIDESKKLTASITIKLTQSDYDVARALADRKQLPLAEWARGRFLEMLGGRGASPDAYAILAEVIASEDALIGLLSTLGRDGRFTAQKAKEIIDAAHERKYRDVIGLFRDAHSAIEARTRQDLAGQSAAGAPATTR